MIILFQQDDYCIILFLTAAFLTGLMAILFGIIMGSLGNIFQVIYSLSGVIAGPLKGLFLAGMVLPWVNAKGAFVGFLVSFCFSVWLMIGQLLKGGGTPPQLPLSVEGCPVFSNSTLDTFPTLATASLASANISVEHTEEEKGIYDISYCYHGMIALLLTIVVSGAVSLLTKPTPPEDLKEGVVNPTCERLYRRWYYTGRRDTCSLEPVNGLQEAVTMLPVFDSNLHCPQ
ncbi:sodium-coupled monocarboxylate transporter 1-like [Scylla paramamosain]|uniref:sodium-coupled monocarboxylate transporter 1-like n=1 Tax=Scylla paramamosain TaxID=85552 RepID=UPI0030834909